MISPRFVVIVATAALCLCGCGVTAQAPSASGPLGVWRGTSLCQVRPSPCHDEVVVYRITRIAKDSVSLDARKIVNGQEEEMGVFRCLTAEAETQVTCGMARGEWHFTIRGDSLVGDLRLSDGRKFRDVRTARSR